MQIKRKGKTKIELRYCKLKMIKTHQEEMKSLQMNEEKMPKENALISQRKLGAHGENFA